MPTRRWAASLGIVWLCASATTLSASTSASSGTRRRMSSPRHRDVLRLHELHLALVRALTAEAALLGAAKRPRRRGDEPAVEPDHAEVELLRPPHAAAEILRIEVGDQAVLGVVGAPHHLVLRLERLDRGDRAEDLLVEHAGAVLHVVE